MMPQRGDLERYQRWFEAVCSNATVAVFMLDDRQHCIYMNPAAEALTGFTLAEMQGRALHDVIHHTRPDGTGYPRRDCPIHRAFSLNDREEGTEVFVHKDGHFYPIAYTASPIHEAGAAVGSVVEVRDIRRERGREEALREETRTLEILNQTGVMLAAKLDMQDIVQAVTDAATELSGARFGAFFYNVTDDRGEILQLYTLSGAPRSAFEDFPSPRNTPIFGPTLRGEGIIRVDDITKDPRYGRNPPNNGMPPGHLPVRSYLAVPVVSRSGEVLGGLFFGHEDPGVFRERAERIVAGIAAQAAVAIDNARLVQRAQVEIAERRRAEQELRESEARLRATHEHVQVGICEIDPTGRFQAVNETFCLMLGYSRDELLGRTFADYTQADDIDSNHESYRRLLAGESKTLDFDKRYVRKDGRQVWANVRSTLIRDAAGQPAYALIAVLDITDRKRAEQHQKLLVDELNHRAKNMLATVQAIATQTFRGSGSAEGALADFKGRLFALSSAHTLLMRQNWTGVSLSDLAVQTIEPFQDEHDGRSRISMEGEDVRLTPNLALALGMAFYELGTNAAKYGALSSEEGRVRLVWGHDRDRLHIAWQESGGPTVEPPTKKGFGSRLIEGALGRETGGTFRLNFDPAGATCVIEIPMPVEEET